MVSLSGFKHHLKGPITSKRPTHSTLAQKLLCDTFVYPLSLLFHHSPSTPALCEPSITLLPPLHRMSQMEFHVDLLCPAVASFWKCVHSAPYLQRSIFITWLLFPANFSSVFTPQLCSEFLSRRL